MNYKDQETEISSKDVLLLVLTGFVAGTVSGMFGAGGGIITVFVVTSYLEKRGKGTRDVFINSLIVTITFATVSAIGYAKNGNIDVRAAAILAVPAILGGLIGSILLRRLRVEWIRWIFAIAVIYSGLKMMLG